MSAAECTFFDRNIVEDVHVVDIDTGIGKRNEPAREEIHASGLSFAVDPTGRLENDVLREHLRKTAHVMRVEGIRAPLKCFARGQRLRRTPAAAVVCFAHLFH